MIAIVDYGMGDLASVEKALNFLSLPNIITNDPTVIRSSSSIILPGVGSFGQGMKNLKVLGLDRILTEEVVQKKKKFLGICLGMQLIADKGTEPADVDGLGWINAKVLKIEDSNLRIPHLGWNDIIVTNDNIFSNVYDRNYYFIHSYHVVVKDPNCIAAVVDYGSHLVAAIKLDNIFAVQFHPEKSQSAGLKFLENYFASA